MPAFLHQLLLTRLRPLHCDKFVRQHCDASLYTAVLNIHPLGSFYNKETITFMQFLQLHLSCVEKIYPFYLIFVLRLHKFDRRKIIERQFTIMSRSILVAQSDPTLMNLHALMLKRAGHIIAKVSNASTLASALQQYTFDVIVYDPRIDLHFEVLHQHLPLLRDARTTLIITAFDEFHQPYARALGLPFDTIAPTAVTLLNRLIQTLTVDHATVKRK
jgi:CheY-like chemotaxis protein